MTHHNYDWILCLPRGVGHTTAAAAKAPDLEHIVITPTHRQADQVRRDHNVQALGMLSASRALMGRRRAVVFDLEAVKQMAQEIGRLQDIVKTYAPESL